LLRLALLCLLLGSQSLSAAHQLTHDFDAAPAGDSVQCPVCTLGGGPDGVLESHARYVAPEFAGAHRPEPATPSTPLPAIPTGQPRAPPVNA
jgi:hypothetical protein